MWSLHDRIHALVRRDTRELLPYSIMYRYGEKVPSASQEVSPPKGVELGGILGLGCLDSRTVRNEFLSFQLPSCGIMVVQTD